MDLLSIASVWHHLTQILSAGVDGLTGILFFPLGGQLPLIVLWLLLGILFASLRMAFINLRGFGHALAILRGKYEGEEQEDQGEVSHWQAFTTALSGTVGLGNIAGV